MIGPKKDRLDYCSSLKPDDGFCVSKAICFTYSLDFVSLLSTVFALAVDEDMEAKYRNNEIPASHIVEVLMNFKDKLYIYSDAAEIKKPENENKIFSIFDSCIKKFNSKTKKSFHPKLWLIEYVDCKRSNDYRYKLLISSRNLAVSHDWDYGMCFEGDKCNETRNKTLCSLLNDLSPSFNELTGRLKNVMFKNYIDKTHFKIWDVYNTYGEQNKKAFSHSIILPVFRRERENTLLMSPFISDSVLRTIYSRTKKELTIITRQETLTNIDEDIFEDNRVSVYVLSDGYVNSNQDDEQIFGDIHAKFYLMEYKDHCSIVFGSSNCTNNGLGLNDDSNIESDIVIDFYKRTPELKNYFQNTMKELLDDNLNAFVKVDDNLFNKIRSKRKEKEESFDVASLIKQIISIGVEGKYNQESESIVLKTKDSVTTDGFKLYITHFSSPKAYQEFLFKKEMTFNGISFAKASRFFLFKVVGKKSYERVLLFDIKNLDTEKRNQEILNGCVQEKEDVIRYLLYLFDEETGYDQIDMDYNSNDNREGDYAYFGNIEAPLYERALELSYSDPDRMRTIVSKFNKLSDDVKKKSGLIDFMNVFLESIR